MPPSMMQPTYDWTFKVVPVSAKMTKTPVAAIGTESITTSGSRNDSYCAARTM